MKNALKGRGSQRNPSNPFLNREFVMEHWEGIDEELWTENPDTRVFYENPKKVINKVDSPDLRFGFSLNPYQGCEHGCVYCYARNTHTYWGFSAGLDFERKIIVKRNAPEILEKEFLKKTWTPATIMLSGNTDCYQPLERKLKITRALLKKFLQFRNPVGLITKNSLILRDLDLLKELAARDLVHVFISVTSVSERIRRMMEPRTASLSKRLDTVQKLSEAGIPAGVMMAPVIPSINDHEIPAIIKEAFDHKAWTVKYTVVRLNGQIGEIFKEWIFQNLEDRASKVWSQIESLHGGKVNDSKFGRRMRGDGKFADHIRQLYEASMKKYFTERSFPKLDTTQFVRPGTTLNLF